jgi:hypothetical protein
LLFSPDIFNDHPLLAVPARVGLRAHASMIAKPIPMKRELKLGIHIENYGNGPQAVEKW